ncbi:MAG: SagB/ThcOx family dehydrogenase, partial [Chloroflexota bacterium]
RFERSAIPFAALSTIVRIASGGIVADFPALNDMYLIVNAVDGLASGSYYFDHEQMGLEPLRRGDFRDIAGRLDLGQELATDAAVNVYFLADLRIVLPALGNRGYRSVQMDASIRAGKMYLAAYSLGLAATGLTFFDDEVTDFFSAHAEGKDVMFLIALGRAG